MITSLGLTNFKAFASIDVPLGRYTLLSGLNSSGKTTVLQALALFRQSNLNVTSRSTTGSLILNGQLVEIGSGQDVLHEDFRRSNDDSGPKIGLALEIEDWGRIEWQAHYLKDASELQVDQGFRAGQVSGQPSNATIFNPGFQYLRADRLNPAVTFPRSRDRATGLGFLGTHGEYSADFLLRHQDDPVANPVLHHPSAASPRLLDQVEAWMSEVCPGVRIHTADIERTDLVRLGFQQVQAGQPVTNPYRPTNVGFGLTYVLPVILACLTARQGAMMLLENPEAHLHPRGQSAIARLTCCAAASGAQVLVETHSDHVLNGVRLSVKSRLLESNDVVLNYFYRDKLGLRIINPAVDPDGMVSQWPAGFFDEWDRAIDKLLDED